VNSGVVADNGLTVLESIYVQSRKHWCVYVSFGPTLTESAARGRAQLCLCDCVSNPGSPGAASDIPITANCAWTLTPVPRKLWWCNQAHFHSVCEKKVGASDQDLKNLHFHICLFYSCFSCCFSWDIVCGHHFITLKISQSDICV